MLPLNRSLFIAYQFYYYPILHSEVLEINIENMFIIYGLKQALA